MRCFPVAALLAGLVVAGCSSRSSSSSSKADPSPAPAEAELPDLLRQVPATTPYVVHLPLEMLSMVDGSSEGEQIVTEAMTKLATRVLGSEQLATASPHARLRSELARELLPLDATTLARVGWDRTRSELVVYGHGLVPVMRASMDGAAARAAVKRAVERAGAPVVEATVGTVPYVILPPLGDEVPPAVIVFHPAQVAIAFSHRPEDLLPHLASLAPATPSMATDRQDFPRDPDAPAHAYLYLAVAPVRLAAAARAGELQRVTRDATFSPPCVDRIAALLDRLPAMRNDVWIDGRTVTHSYAFAVSPPMRSLFEGATGLVRWSSEPPADLELAVGFRPAAVIPGIEALWTELQATRAACGEAPEPPLGLMAKLGPIAQVTGFTIVGDDRGDAVHLGGALEVREVTPVWSWIAAQMPIGALPPLDRIEEVGTINGLMLAMGRGPTTIYASLGSTERVLALANDDSGSAPDVLLRLALRGKLTRRLLAGEVEFFGIFHADPTSVARATDMGVEARLDGDVLLVRQWGDLPAESP